jgi:hypothetical protein
MARTNNPHEASVKSWETRRGEAQDGGRRETVQQRGDWGTKPASPLEYNGLTPDSPEVKALAEKAHAAAVFQEPEATRAVTAAIEASGGHLSGLAHRIKAPDAIANKIIRDCRSDHVEPEAAIAKLNDIVRYTALYPASVLVERVAIAHKSLLDAGWEHFDSKAKNFFAPGDPYDGYNCVYINKKTGAKFEMQFHTPESIKIKALAHDIYKKYRELPAMDTARHTRKRLFDEMVGLWNNYDRPTNWEKLPGKITRQRSDS